MYGKTPADVRKNVAEIVKDRIYRQIEESLNGAMYAAARPICDNEKVSFSVHFKNIDETVYLPVAEEWAKAYGWQVVSIQDHYVNFVESSAAPSTPPTS